MKMIFLLLFAFDSVALIANPTPSHSYKKIEDLNDLKILTPSLLSRSTSKIRLDNGLEALIISDPKAEESAAALAVGVGSWSDPKEFPGMAHFLEHMLFMGTKAYPDEQAFSSYISDHGGISNAYTALDRTVYMFSINNDAFVKGLDIFSHFFIDPLFKESQVGRELHAVDQEHSKNIENDYRRSWMIFKETGNPNHPNHAFATGNAQTLGHIPQSALINFYNKYYSASKMHLVIYSPLSLNQLEKLVVDDFSSVPLRQITDSIPYMPLSSETQKGSITYIKPLKDLKILTLSFELPENISKDRFSSASDALTYAIGSGGPKSLSQYLKDKNLAEEISATVSFFSIDHSFFTIQVLLTNEGLEQKEKVIEKIFETLALYRNQGYPDDLFNEYLTMSLINYQYQSNQKAFEYVCSAADDLIAEPLSTYPKQTKIPSALNNEKLKQVILQLRPEKCIYSIMASPELTKVTPTHKEKWNGGEYAIVPIKPSLIAAWSDLQGSKEIGLPEKNPFLPSSLKLDDPLHTSQVAPLVLQDDLFGKDYYFKDTTYLTPESVMITGIKSPVINETALSSVYCDILVKNFYLQNASLLALAERAGLECSLGCKNMKLVLTIKGYSQKAPDFYQLLIKTLSHMTISKNNYEMIKESLLASYVNQSRSQPYQQAGEQLSHILYNDAPLSSEKNLILQNLTIDEYLGFIKSLWEMTYLESIYGGNIAKETAQALAMDSRENLCMKIYPARLHLKKTVIALPVENGPFKVSIKAPVLGNATLLTLQQGEFSFSKKAVQLIMSAALSETFFNTLRSQQQTGYITTSWPREVDRQMMQFFLVQSTSHQPEDLLNRFELFLEGYVKDFSAKLSNERFDEIRKNCIETLSQKPTDLLAMSEDFYATGFEKNGDFEYQKTLCLALNELSYEELKEISLSFLSRKNGKRLALLIEGISKEKKFAYKEISPKILKQDAKLVLSKEHD